MKTKPGAAYLRISDDSEGLALGIARQREDVIALAAQHGIDLPPERILEENDVGASTRSKKKRPKYEQIKTWVRDGTVSHVLFYSNSRLTRRPLELEEWISLHEQTGVKLISKVSGNDDLSTADGRMIARIKASVDAAEAERISERVKRAFAQRRAQGLPTYGGPRAWGFKAAPKGQHNAAPELEPAEAAGIADGAQMLLTGASIGQVIREWEARGLKPVRAKAFTRTFGLGVYRSPRIAGLVEYEGEIVAEGAFPAIITRATWEAVQEALGQRGEKRGAGYGARTHKYAGFVFCGECGSTMIVRAGKYVCVKERQGCGKVKRSQAWIDSVLDGYMEEKLRLVGEIEADVTEEQSESEADKLEARIRDLRQRFGSGGLGGEDFYPLLSDLRQRVTEARKRDAERARLVAQRAATHDPFKVWNGDSLAGKRALISGHLKGVYIKAVGRIGRADPPLDSYEIVPA